MTTEKDYKITLDQVVQVYRKALSVGSLLVTGFFQETVPTKDGTLAIDKNGRFYYCPAWCIKWLTNPERFKDGVLHEMMHPVLGDMAREMSHLKNFASDAVINAMLYTMGMARCELMEAFYPKNEKPECILRPFSVPPQKLAPLYHRLYTGSNPPSPLEVADALRVLFPQADWSKVKLIGTHGKSQPTETMDGKPINSEDLCLPSEVVGNTADELIKAVKHGGGGAGYSSSLTNKWMKVLKTRASLRAKVIKAFTCKDKVNKIRQAFEPAEPDQSVVPVRIGRRESFLLASDRDPLYFDIPQEEESSKDGVHVFFDVSGSTWSELPKVLGLLRAIGDVIEVVYQFSNKVVRTSVSEMVKDGKAKIDTTGGTDFNCVIEYCLEHGIRKALVFTDGDAYATKENQEKALRYIDKIGLVYFGRWQNRKNWLQEQYKLSFELKELVQENGR